MTDFISSLNYCHFSTVKVDCGNANFSKFFMYAKIISSHSTMHYNASVYPQIVKTKPCSSYSKCKTNFEQVISHLNLKLNPKFASYLNFLQFFIVYPGISNPGPVTGNRRKDLSVFYQNVQGLIPFGSLTDQHPNLDIIKIYELQAYIFEKNPDIIILNETWLEPTILSSEIFPKQYNVFRLDRSPQSHPVDPLNPKKFRKNGGGVLTATIIKIRAGTLNKDLNDINWDNVLDYQGPETAWSNFKKTLFEQINNHVTKFTIKSEFQPPWFDSECYSKCKEKDKLHKIYKKKKTLASEIRFKTARRDFESLIKSKMRANLDTENRNMLTKKFWSHIETTNKSTRIPEVVSCGAIATSDPTTKANLFNYYFRKQFSEPSSYDIDINFQNNCDFDVDLSVSRIRLILNNLDINKAQGPGNINGTVLKHCSESLAYPLSKLFKLTYNVGCPPSEWKTSNIVPVHKKDNKTTYKIIVQFH